MRKFFSLIAAVLFAGSMMATDATMTAGTNGSTCTVNGKDGIKCGTSKNAGDMTITVGADATSLTLYAAAWKGVNGASIAITAPEGVTATPASLAITPDDGISNNTPFTLAGTEADFKFEITLTGVSAETTLTLACSKRFVVWGATYGTGEVTPPDPVEEYYLVGSMNEWVVSADYKLTRNTAAEGNEYKIDITLTEGNQEMKVKGVLEGREEDAWYPGGTNNNFTINDAGDYTIYFRPNADGGDGWHEGYIFAEYHAPAEPITCLEVYQMAKNDVVDLLNDVVVTYANGKNVWVRDETASMLIFLPANSTAYKAGDVLSGVAGTVDIYNGVTEIKPSAAQVTAIAITEGEAPAAIELAVVEAGDVNKYIVLKNIAVNGTFAEGTASNITLTLGESSVVLRNNFKNGFAFDAEKTYDIYGVVTIYQSNPQIYFITAEEHVATAIENTNAAVKATKAIENGKLVIIKNGVRFDATGARL